MNQDIKDNHIQILLVEDNPADARLVVECLKEIGLSHELHIAENGEDALAYVRKLGQYNASPRPDLILLDLNLPKKDGFEVLEEIKADHNLKNIPVVVMSAARINKTFLKKKGLEANLFINKPIDPEIFMDAVRTFEHLRAIMPSGCNLDKNEKKTKILLVEDNPADTRLIREMLSEVPDDTALALICVNRLSDSLACFSGNLPSIEEGQPSPDVILLDLTLPDSHGFETFTEQYYHSPDVPIIVLTGLNDKEMAIKAVSAGAQDYLIKGQLDSDILWKSIRYAIERQGLMTVLKQKTSEVLSSEKRLNHIIMKNVDGIIIVSMDNIVRFMNPAAEKLLGKKASLLQNKPFGFPVSLDTPVELEIPDNNDQTTILEMRAIETAWDNEQVYLASVRDVSERIRMQEEIIRKNDTLDAINNIFRESMTCRKTEDVIFKGLTVAEDLTKSMAGFIGMLSKDGNIGSIVIDDSKDARCTMSKQDALKLIKALDVKGIWDDIIKGGKTLINNKADFHTGIDEYDGSMPVIRFMCIPIKVNETVTGILVMLNKNGNYDQNDQKAVEALSVAVREAFERKKVELNLERRTFDLKQTVKELEKVNRTVLDQQKSVIEEERVKILLQMAGATAHQLNQPLTALLGNIELLRMTANVPDNITNFLERIKEAGFRIDTIVKKIQNIRNVETIPYAGYSTIINLDQKLNILYVEDSDADFALIRELLKKYEHFMISRARNIHDAMEILHDRQFDAILLDYILPDGNGLDFLSRIKDIEPALPVIVITGQSNEMMASRMIQAGALDYIPKDRLSSDNLFKSIEKTLEKTRLKKEIIKAQNKMAEMSIRDEVTGLYNRKFLDEKLEEEFSRAHRYKTDLSCLTIDMDHFRKINDMFGHAFGDFVLKEFSESLRSEIRNSDLFFRVGEDEFVILLPNTDIKGACKAAEKIREKHEKEIYKGDSSEASLFISIGASSLTHHHPVSPEDLVVYADKAMLQAKICGGNCVKIYE